MASWKDNHEHLVASDLQEDYAENREAGWPCGKAANQVLRRQLAMGITASGVAPADRAMPSVLFPSVRLRAFGHQDPAQHFETRPPARPPIYSEMPVLRLGQPVTGCGE